MKTTKLRFLLVTLILLIGLAVFYFTDWSANSEDSTTQVEIPEQDAAEAESPADSELVADSEPNGDEPNKPVASVQEPVRLLPSQVAGRVFPKVDLNVLSLRLPEEQRAVFERVRKEFPPVDWTEKDESHQAFLDKRADFPLNLNDEQREAYATWMAEVEPMSRALIRLRAEEHGISTGGMENNQAFCIDGFRNGEPIYLVTTNATAAVTTGASYIRFNPGSPRFDPELGDTINGSGVYLNVNDIGGIGQHSEFQLPDNGGSRILMDEPRPPDSPNTSHMTHVTGTLAAWGYNPKIQGMAPRSWIRGFYALNTWHLTSYAMATPGQEMGEINPRNGNPQLRTVVGNTSLGFSSPYNRYNSTAAAYDVIMRDHPYYMHFNSAGNSGSNGFETLTADWKIAKNMINIGNAVSATRDADGVLTSGGTISGSSSRGPTYDGRISPDFVAKGNKVLSTIGSNTGSDTMTGTSMASPNAAGSVALLMDYVRQRMPQQYLRSSTYRALLATTADDRGNPGPDYIHGWGLINVHAAAKIVREQANNSALRLILEESLSRNQTWTETYASSGTKPIRVTIAWLDPASSNTDENSRASRLVNDLDLRIIGPDNTEHKPYVMPFTTGQGTTAAYSTALYNANAVSGDNVTDPVEQVYIAAPDAGFYTVRVTHKGNLLSNADQPFSVAISGLTNDFDPVMIVSGENGEIPVGGTHATTGTVARSTSQFNYNIANQGINDLTLSTPVTFSAVNNCSISVTTQPSSTVAPDGNTNFALSIRPSAAGNWSATVSIANNDSDRTPYTWTISGTAASGHALAYDGNGNNSGTPPTDPKAPYLEGSTVTVLGNSGNLTKDQFTFAGWNTAANGSGTSYAPGNTFAMPNGSVTLFAQWNIATYTATYTAGTNGSISGQSPQTIQSGGATSAVTAVPNSGYTFKNWSDGSTANPRSDTNVTANISVTANFETNQAPTANAGADQSPVFVDERVLWTPNPDDFAAWFDAKDPDTIVFEPGSTTAVRQWSDKSGKGRHLTQTTTSAQPTLGVDEIQMPVNKYMLSGDGLMPSGSGGRHVFAVVNNTTTTNVGFISQAHGSWNARTGFAITGEPAVRYNGAMTFNGGALSASDNLIAVSYDSGTNVSTMRFAVNGSQRVGTISSGDGLLASNATKLYVGCNHLGSLGTSQGAADFRELIILTDSALSTDTRQKLEGYLAHKWNLTDSLPSSPKHPYKDSEPMTGNFGATVTLNGSVGDPNQTTPTAAWSVVSTQPVGLSVEFANAASPVTTATFLAPGTYTLRLTASDGIAAPVSDDVVITVRESGGITTYTVSYTAGANGTISGQSPQTVSAGGSTTSVTAVPNSGYRFTNWSDGSTANPRSDTNVTANISVTANFELIPAPTTYTVSYIAGANGTITGQSSQTVNAGGSTSSVTAAPNSGYLFKNWSDGSTANPRTDTNVTANLSVTANFELIPAPTTYTVTYTAGANGSITGQSSQTVNAGGSTSSVTAAPNSGYLFKNWSDGSTANPRTDTNVNSNLSVIANFELKPPLTADAGQDQTIFLDGGTGVPWTPNPSELQAWFDASDTGTIVLENGSTTAVKQWLDKSGYGRHLTQTNTSAQPTLGDNEIQMPVNKFLTSANGMMPTGSGGRHVFAVINNPTTTADGIISQAHGSWSARTGFAITGEPAVRYNGAMTYNGGALAATDSLIAVSYDSGSNVSTMRYAVNGTNRLGTIISGDGPLASNNTVLHVGRSYISGGSASKGAANFRELIILTDDTLSVDTQQKIEGYLAHKWGLTANLPEGHPYKQAAPTTDGASATATLNGTVDAPTATWSVVSTQPAGLSVNFANSASAVTTASFTAVGTYTLRLTASDGIAAPVSDDVVITVQESGGVTTYTVSYTAGTNGSITGQSSQTVSAGGSTTAVTAQPNSGYRFTNWSDGSTANPRSDTNVSANISVTAVFEVQQPLTADAGEDQTVALVGESIPWTPADMATTLWLDATDGSTISADGSNLVSEWRDKRGTGLNLTQATASRQPTTGATINSLNALDFTGDVMTTATNPFGATVSDAFVITVHKVDAIADGILFSMTGATSPTGSRWQANAPWGSGGMNFDVNASTTGPNRLSAPYGASAGSTVLSSFYSSTTDNVQQVYQNGALLAGDSTGASANTVSGLSIGGVGTTCQNTTIGEMIVINGTVSVDDRQKLEGYLAHKWGLTANLPEGHPYKGAAPTTGGGTVAIVTLEGSVSDPNGGSPMANWSVVSTQPAGLSVEFADPSLPGTSASFTAAGIYTLRLTATSGAAAPVSDQVVITVESGQGSQFAAWMADHGMLADAGLMEDADGDGKGNLMEFAFGTNPAAMDMGALTVDGMERGDPVAAKEGGADFALYYIRRTDHGSPGSVVYTTYFSNDLVTFEPSSVGLEVVGSAGDGYELVKVPFPTGARFGYVKVEAAP